MECVVIFGIQKALDLPQTDALSKIDPYLKVVASNLRGPAAQVTHTTKVLDDNDNPQWNETFTFITTRDSHGSFQGTIRVELYDENPLRDSHVAYAELNLGGMTRDRFPCIELPFVYVKDKYSKQGKRSRVVLAILGCPLSYNGLRAASQSLPGVLFNDTQHRLYAPVPLFQGVLYAGVEYEYKGVTPIALDVKLFVTVPNCNLFVDMGIAGRKSTKVRRRTYASGYSVLPNLKVYEEVKLDDVSVATNFDQLLVFCFDKQLISSTNAAEVVKAHGWRGAMGYQQAKTFLHNIEYDDEKEEIYMSVDGSNEYYLIVDYDKDNADIKLGVAALPSTADKAFDLVNGENRRLSSLYNPPVARLRGKFNFSRIYELDDVKYGSKFSTMGIFKYHVGNMRQFSLQSIVNVMGH